jgi:hypothetical protein
MPWDIYADNVATFGPIPPERRYCFGLIADRNILGGEELLVDYGRDYDLAETAPTYHHVPRN